jgi:gamma-D-glutamyl-L-lysine dipeptidyl-peptidase
VLLVVGVLAAPATAAPLGSGGPLLAWVRVSVATVWVKPSSPRALDAGALGNPVAIGRWLQRLDVRELLGLDSRIETQLLLGEQVIVLAARRGWWKVEIPEQRGSRFPKGIIGWLPSVQLSTVAPLGGPVEAIVTAPGAMLYRLTDGVVGAARFPLSYDTQLPLLTQTRSFWVVGLPGGGRGAIAVAAASSAGSQAVSVAALVAQARRFLGLPYLWGGTSSFGYDCSGLVYALYDRYGIELPRDAADQQHAGTPVRLDALRPGDLLFFAGPHGHGRVHHVAIYAGGGLMIDAPQSGAAVELIPMISSPVWGEFAGATRIVAG